MIEHLIHSDHIREGSKHRRLTEKIIRLKRQLYIHLDPRGKEEADQLASAYLEQAAALIEDAFIEGFCTAVDLALDYLNHKNIRNPITNQPQPPGP